MRIAPRTNWGGAVFIIAIVVTLSASLPIVTGSNLPIIWVIPALGISLILSLALGHLGDRFLGRRALEGARHAERDTSAANVAKAANEIDRFGPATKRVETFLTTLRSLNGREWEELASLSQGPEIDEATLVAVLRSAFMSAHAAALLGAAEIHARRATQEARFIVLANANSERGVDASETRRIVFAAHRIAGTLAASPHLTAEQLTDALRPYLPLRWLDLR